LLHPVYNVYILTQFSIEIDLHKAAIYNKNMYMTCDKLVVFFGFLHQQNWPPRYNWSIVESGVKQHQTNIYCLCTVHRCH